MAHAVRQKSKSRAHCLAKGTRLVSRARRRPQASRSLCTTFSASLACTSELFPAAMLLRIWRTVQRSTSESWRALFFKRDLVFSAFLKSFATFFFSARNFACSSLRRSIDFRRNSPSPSPTSKAVGCCVDSASAARAGAAPGPPTEGEL